MTRLRTFLSRLWALVRLRQMDRDIDDEIAGHLAEATDAYIQQGLSREDARWAALRSFGGVTQTKEVYRQVWSFMWLEDLARDLRHALRLLRRSPGFTIVAIFTLALGIGANTAIFTVVNAVLLRPLPFVDSHRLVRIWESSPARGWPTFGASYPNYLDWQAQTRTFEQLAASTGVGFTLTDGDGADRVNALAVTHGFLPMLRVRPLLGRNFTTEEDRPSGNTRVALLTYSSWQRRFGGDPGAIGRTITLNNQPFSIVGVLPEEFAWGAQAGSASVTGALEMLVPLAPDPARPRGDHRLAVYGRLKEGISIDQARDDLSAVAAALERQFPDSNQGWTVRLLSFFDWMVPEATRRSLALFGAAVLAVLLIACTNVASLSLARATARYREISVRLALGAGRSRLLRQLLVESVLLSLIASAGGVAMAWGATSLLRTMNPGSLPRMNEVSVDWSSLAFSLTVAVITGVLFGLVPALTALRVDVNETLKEGGRSGAANPARQRLREALIVSELAMSVALLVGGGMLLRSFWQVQRVDPGFESPGLITMQVRVPSNRLRNHVEAWSLYERLLSDVKRVPGVQAVATTSGVPLTSSGNTATEVRIPGRAPARDDADLGSAGWRVVSPEYFKTMGIRLRGRDFTPTDVSDAQWVTIVSEAFAARYFPGEEALGRSVTLASLGNRPRVIIGIAGDVRSFGLDAEPGSTVYFPMPAIAAAIGPSLVLRAAGDPRSVVPSVRAVLRAIDPASPVFSVATADELLAQSLGPRRFMMFLVLSFASIALILAAVGLFGVMAYLVSQRAREIGIRLALGAHPSNVIYLVLGRGVVLALTGALAGVVAAYWLSPLMKSFLFEVEALDPIAFAGAPLLLVATALLACYLPARRAMRVDPLVALRDE